MAFNSSKALANAQKHIQRRNWDKAAREYEQIVKHDPSDMRSVLKLADLYMRGGRSADALRSYTQVAYHYLNDDIYDKAVAVFKQALQVEADLGNENAELHRDLGEAYHRLGRLKEAIRSFHKAREIYRSRRDGAHERDILERMVRIDPEDIGLRVQLAERYERDGMRDEAIGLLTFAADKLEEEGRQDEFLKVAERIIFLNSDDYPLRKKVARLHGERADYRRALQHLQKCFEDDPLDIDTLRMLSFAFEQIEEPQRAGMVYFQLGRVYQNQGQPRMAESAYRSVLRLDPEDQNAHQALAALGAGPSPAAASTVMAPVQPAQPEPQVDVMADVEFLDDDLGLELGLGPAPASPAPMQAAPAPQPAAPRPAQPAQPRQARPPQLPAPHLISPPPADLSPSRGLKMGQIYINYGLWERGYESLHQVLMMAPGTIRAHELLAELFDRTELYRQAVREYVQLANLVRTTPLRAAEYLRKARELGPDDALVFYVAAQMNIDLDRGPVQDDIVELDMLGEIEIAPFDDAFNSIANVEVAIEPEPEEEEIFELDDFDLIEEDLEPVQPAQPSFMVSTGQPVVAGTFGGGSSLDIDTDDIMIEEPQPRTTQPGGVGVDAFGLSEQDADAMFDQLFGDAHSTGAGLGGSLPGDSLGVVAEVDYLINQGMMQEAEQQLRQLEQSHPQSNTVQDRRLRINEGPGAGGFTYGGDNSFASRSLSGVFQHPAIEQPSGPLGTVGPAGGQSLPNVLPVEGAMNTNFELGAAYMDMGLFEEASEEFRQALDDPEIADSATYSIAMCEVNLGRADIARRRLEALVQRPQTTPRVREAAQRAISQI